MYIYKIVTQKDRTCKVMTKLKRLSTQYSKISHHYTLNTAFCQL